MCAEQLIKQTAKGYHKGHRTKQRYKAEHLFYVRKYKRNKEKPQPNKNREPFPLYIYDILVSRGPTHDARKLPQSLKQSFSYTLSIVS